MNRATEKVAFSYWSDPMCIWAFVAEDKLDRICAAFGDSLSIETRVVPVFGSVPWRFEAGPWKEGGVARRVAETHRIASELGHPEVSGECWRKELPASSWPAGAAVKAVDALERREWAPSGGAAQFMRALRSAFFVSERNIARRGEILAVAESLGLDRGRIEQALDDGSAIASLWEDHDARERLRIQGSPTYLFDGGRARLYGNFGYGILRATIEELVGGGDLGCTDC